MPWPGGGARPGRGGLAMDEVFAVRFRLAPERLAQLTCKSDARGALQLASHLLALAASGLGLWLTWGSWWGVPLFVVHGVLLNWLYAAQHEASHGTVFRCRRANEWLGRATGFLLLYPRDWDRWQHFCHHRHTQDAEKDAELTFRSCYDGPGAGLLSLLGPLYWLDLAIVMVRHAVCGRRIAGAEDYLTAAQERAVVAEARWHLALYALIAAASVLLESWAAVVLWWAPMLATAWSHQVQNHIEHGGLPFVADSWHNTRTVRAGALLRWLSWQMVYHSAHHSYPAVPFHRLRALHDAIAAQRGEGPPSCGYLDYLAGLALPRGAGKEQPS